MIFEPQDLTASHDITALQIYIGRLAARWRDAKDRADPDLQARIVAHYADAIARLFELG